MEGKVFKNSDGEGTRTLVMQEVQSTKENPGGYKWGKETGADEEGLSAKTNHVQKMS